MSFSTHREVERKLRVHGLFDLPDLAALDLADSVRHHEPYVMRAVYHDTDSLALFRWGVTLRRREGGSDEGWHMKLPVAGADGSARDELRLPLDAGPVGSVPSALVEVVAPLLREQPLRPVVTLSTERTKAVLLDAEGRELVELVDDTVSVLRDERIVSVFRELEVEAVDADDPDAIALLSTVVDALVALGAEPSTLSKAAAALGPRTAEPPDVPAWPLPGPDGLAVDALRSVLSEHVRHLLLADVGVRRDLPDAVHQMRVAARRLRSTLATFAPLMDAETAAPLREELKWIASELGAIRDTEVMIERLGRHADDLDNPLDAQLARQAVDTSLQLRLHAARSSALAALRSDRHAQLVADLTVAAVDPPVTDAAFATCEQALLPLVARSWRRLARAIADLELDGPSHEWHEARIKAKRARYAADAAAGIFGRRMQNFARTLADVTELLGDHQDAHIAQSILRELAAQADTDGSTGMALGVLHEYEADEEIIDRYRFDELWPHARSRAVKAGVAR